MVRLVLPDGGPPYGKDSVTQYMVWVVVLPAVGPS